MVRILLSHGFPYRVRNPRTAIIALRPILLSSHLRRGPGSVVGIATGYGLDGPGIESRWGARFSAPVQTGLEAHPASCTMGTGSFPRSKERPGRDVDPTLPSSAVSRNSGAIPLLPLRTERPVQSLSACTRVHFTFFPFTLVRGLVPLGFPPQLTYLLHGAESFLRS